MKAQAAGPELAVAGGREAIDMFRKSDLKVHFVGIGGMGMCGIAEVMINMGYQVSGSDTQETAITRHLASIGGRLTYGHRAENLDDADVVVVSSAIKGYNPEVEAARARQIPIIPRAEMLNELMRMKYGIAVAGAHGKTTSTTMMHTVLMAAGFDPTAVIGGRVNSLGLANARWGKSDYLVAEADESDGSFLTLTPTVAIVTNVDAEHLDHYGTLERLLDAFVGFANRVPFYGMTAICLDDPNVRAIQPRLTKRTVSYAIAAEDADYRAIELDNRGGRSSFTVVAHGQVRGRFELSMPGRHNVLNALASIALCDEQGVSTAVSRKALAEFSGVQRRFTLRGQVDDIAVVDDYGHHPTELRATLSAARDAHPQRRIVACFQPHRYTRVRNHFDEFVASLDDADLVVLTSIYAAGEAPIPGIDSSALAKQLRARKPAREVVQVEGDDIVAATTVTLRCHVRPGDLVLTLGAGSITKVSFALVEALAETQSSDVPWS